MFICPKCGKAMQLPKCKCGNTVSQKDGIWQLTDMPDSVKEGGGDRYIGYEEIGEAYSGGRKYLMEEGDILVSAELSEITGDGVLLDLGCGDGCFTVPCAQNGTRIVAGDISNKMLSILQKKALHNGVSLKNVTVCRMNALDLPLADGCVDTVIANSVLHLISNPQKVISEIYRVLKRGGAFVCLDDAPGNQSSDNAKNSLYFEIVNSIYAEYWKQLSNSNIVPQKYNWNFDRDSLCEGIFRSKSEKILYRGGSYTIPLSDGFLPRFLGRGFSDQTDVPKDLHEAVTERLVKEFREKYGENFEAVSFVGEYSNILITAYRK